MFPSVQTLQTNLLIKNRFFLLCKFLFLFSLSFIHFHLIENRTAFLFHRFCFLLSVWFSGNLPIFCDKTINKEVNISIRKKGNKLIISHVVSNELETTVSHHELQLIGCHYFKMKMRVNIVNLV